MRFLLIRAAAQILECKCVCRASSTKCASKDHHPSGTLFPTSARCGGHQQNVDAATRSLGAPQRDGAMVLSSKCEMV